MSTCPDIMQAIYDLLITEPAFPEPKFTDFTRVPKAIPIRLASGEPNPDFFIQWFDNCKKFVCGQ